MKGLVVMRKLFLGSAAVAAAMLATPAAAQIYVSVGSSPYYGHSYGYSPYSYGYSSYGYSPYSYGYSPYSYGYSSYGYSPYSYGYSPYSYSSYGYSAYGYGSHHCLRRHHRNGVVYYTRVC
jgi:hypothetical protein